jgi:CubicO group peptidase (beta-lactamase class C family)
VIRRLLPIALTASLSAGVLVHAADDLVLSRFGDYLDSLRIQAGIPGLAATIVNLGDINWERTFGQRDIERNLGVFPDTPFHLDGTTQLISAALALRCVEEGRLSLDERQPGGATVRELLSHTTAGPGGPVFAYVPERLDALAAVIAGCTGTSFAGAVQEFLDRLAMFDSMPGSDVMQPPNEVTPAMRERYTGIFERLARPYAVDSRGRATPSQYTALTLTPASGLISTARDLARFDLAIKKGAVLQPESLAVAWTPPVDANGQRLPHGLGWFVQSYNGERIVWQFGVSDNASSSMIVTVPGRGLTLILLANSQGLSRPFSLAAGNVTVSPFARLFLSIFVR